MSPTSWQQYRARERRQKYQEARQRFLKENMYCRVKWACRERAYPARATQVHHARGRVGNDLLDEDSWWPTCDECHHAIHLKPKEAYARGLMESRHDAVRMPYSVHETTPERQDPEE